MDSQTYADLDALEAQIAASTVTYPDVSTLIAELRAARKVVEVARKLNALDLLLQISEHVGGAWDVSDVDADAVAAAFAELTAGLGEVEHGRD